ncbi:hypothetical protein E2562_028983 [Oryza meyeriana var. granulata]|uniref:Uncharacterized protein n=1 Tax=Oryza meyeriana var. granulata TaxID=110450 RepID=A0A6G1DPR7_9ORYZ|nr:hypothetical protein E2562_028983 [Oryza meyeriana var. granulata]
MSSLPLSGSVRGQGAEAGRPRGGARRELGEWRRGEFRWGGGASTGGGEWRNVIQGEPKLRFGAGEMQQGGRTRERGQRLPP